MEAVAEVVVEFRQMAEKLGITEAKEIIQLLLLFKDTMVVEEKVMVKDLLAVEEEVRNLLVQIANFPQNTPMQVMVAPEDQILIEPEVTFTMGEAEAEAQ